MSDNYLALTDNEKITFLFKKYVGTIAEHGLQTHTELIKNIYKTPELINIVLKAIGYMPESMTLQEKIKSIDYNLKFKKTFEKILNTIDIGKEYKLQYCSIKQNRFGSNAQHVESAFQIDILGGEKKVASFNFFFTFEKGIKEIRINNLQAEKGTNKLKDINKTFRNWRVKVVSEIINIGNKSKSEIIGELPKRFRVPGITDSEYIKILKNYLETFVFAGIKASNIEFKRVESRFEVKLREHAQEIVLKKHIKNKKSKPIKIIKRRH